MANTTHSNMTDRDLCYWLDGWIDKGSSYWDKLKDKTKQRPLSPISDQGGRDIIDRAYWARRNRSGHYDKYTIFVEWLAGVLECWGHLDQQQRKYLNDSIISQLQKVLKPSENTATTFEKSYSPVLISCSSYDGFDRYNDRGFENAVPIMLGRPDIHDCLTYTT